MFKSLFLATFLLSSFAFADGACKADKETLCKDAQSDKAKMFQCMNDNADKLSTECKVHREKVQAALAELKEACSSDVESLCADVEPGDKRIVMCLRKNKEKVSDNCKNALKDMRKMKKKKA